MSIGITTYPINVRSVDKLLKSAGRSCYNAKALRGNRVVIVK